MKYCRYCAFCVNGDCYYCTYHDKVLGTVDRVTSCPDFIMSELREHIKNLKSDNGAPVRHGRWETISDSDLSRTVMCSVCSKTFYFSKRGQLNIDTMPYCPWCGYKMYGGVKENGKN